MKCAQSNCVYLAPSKRCRKLGILIHEAYNTCGLYQKRKGKRKIPKSAYCAYSHNCDKDIDCKNGMFCQAFVHTKDFSSLR